MFKKLLLGLISGLFTLLLLAGLALMGLKWYGDQPLSPSDSDVELELTIAQGDSLIRVANRLAEHGWLEYPELFVLMARVDQVAGDIHAGDYLVPAGISKRQLLSMFISGQIRYYDVTLVEGQALADALNTLNNHEKLQSPMDEKAMAQLLADLEISGNPEGMFYPDTYFFHAGASVESILRRSRTRLEEVLAEEWKNRSEDLPLKTPYEALVMASVIEKETGAVFERPDIAGVFIRRLQKRMRLQSDPTVIYGMGDRYEGRLNRRMLREKTPYNTYTNFGLPPTPIALVGRDAINAALNPAEGATLYFVAKGDGTHFFSETLAEHNRAVRKYQIVERREDYRSTVESQR
ncbi:MAG: endolytic transglycosylase MltG [Endozoicomonas sp.]